MVKLLHILRKGDLVHIATTPYCSNLKIRKHYHGAMLIHAHRSATLSNDRKTEDRPDLGATPPPGPIKEGYPTHAGATLLGTHARRLASSCLFFSLYTPYVSYDLPLHTGGVPIRGFYRASGVSLSLSISCKSLTCASVFVFVPYALVRMCHSTYTYSAMYHTCTHIHTHTHTSNACV